MNVDKILKKKAKGYVAQDVVEEYGVQDEQVILLKRKINYKHVPPDLAALKLFLETTESTTNVCLLSSEQLEKEREQLKEKLEQALQLASDYLHDEKTSKIVKKRVPKNDEKTCLQLLDLQEKS